MSEPIQPTEELIWRTNYLEALEMLEKLYICSPRCYILDRHATFKVLFKCIKKQDMTEFYPIYKKAKEIYIECVEEAKRNACDREKEEEENNLLRKTILTREEYSKWKKSELQAELKRLGQYVNSNIKKSGMIEMLMSLKRTIC